MKAVKYIPLVAVLSILLVVDVRVQDDDEYVG